MNEYYLQSKMKSRSVAYLWLMASGSHYAYLGRWGLQFLFWLTLGGLGIWGIIDIFHLSRKVKKHNKKIVNKIENLKK